MTMAMTHTTDSSGPYASAAQTYWDAGWRGILPLPAGQKKPVPAGRTGRGGTDPSYPDIWAWMEDKGAGNIALRMPHDVIGLDVDDYGDKSGLATLTKHELAHGALPATWRSTSRDTRLGGIRFFRVPPGLEWPGELDGGGIELIQRNHRYAVVFPSLHPEGGTYRWYDADGNPSLTPPRPDQLPDLPEQWVTDLTENRLAVESTKQAVGDQQANAWLNGRPGANDDPCPVMANVLADYVASNKTAHGAMNAAILTATRYADGGHPGVMKIIPTVGRDFIDKVTSPHHTSPRSRDEAAREYLRSITGAVGICIGDPTPASCDCYGQLTAAILEAATPEPALASEPAAAEGSVADGAPPADAREALLDFLVHEEVQRLEVRHRAREVFDARNAPPAEPFDLDTLAGILARPADPPNRIGELLPWSAAMLLIAQRKAGKTTFELNLARSLITGEDFLGAYPVIPVGGSVALLNYEVSARQIATWAAEHGVPADRLVLVNLRGRRNPLADAREQSRLAAELRARQVETVIVDPFGRAYTGQSQNDAGEVGGWLVRLDEFVRGQVGALDLILTAHAGWNGDRTRGSSALEDWGDVLVNISREQDASGTPGPNRYFRAEGRDVDIDEDLLLFDEITRTLSLSGMGGRKQQQKKAKMDGLVAPILELVTNSPGINYKDVVRRLRDALDSGVRDADVSAAVKYLEATGQVHRPPALPGKARPILPGPEPLSGVS